MHGLIYIIFCLCSEMFTTISCRDYGGLTITTKMLTCNTMQNKKFTTPSYCHSKNYSKHNNIKQNNKIANVYTKVRNINRFTEIMYSKE